MDILIIILLSTSILLFIISFFQSDKVKELEKEYEQFSMKMLQENYSLKKRVRLLEEELLIDEPWIREKQAVSSSKGPNEILINHVRALHNQGLPIDQIAKQSTLPLSTIENILSQYEKGEKW